MNNVHLSTIEGGGVASAAGFAAGGIHAGFRDDPARLDMALVEADELCTAAGVFTQNVFCAAPVTVSRAHLDDRGYGTARAVVVNSGIANAATGPDGIDAASRTASLVADAVGCASEDVLVASTGIIGQQLDTTPFETGVPMLLAAFAGDVPAGAPALGATGHDAARAIMTTDTHPKEAAVSYASADPAYEGATFTVGGMAKGSGMIMPNMATMISVITTDAPVAAPALHQALVSAVNDSFNRVTVDGDTSTNDTCILMASGKAAPAGAPAITAGSAAFAEFEAALRAVTTTLARAMAADGEGATKLITVHVTGAATDADADAAARTVANSPLVETGVFWHDSNWVLIAGALGRSGAQFAQENVSIDIMGLPVMRGGLPVPFDEEEALRRFEAAEILLAADLGAGDAEAVVWTCDFSHEYVSINGDYRS